MPALDGVRALAVGAVLAFHGGLPGATGGFLGVDAFFVLSGYLITSLLLAEWTRHEGRIDLIAFWGRRVRRLLPALVLMITTVAVLARTMLPPEEVRLLRGDGVAALLYVANWRMIFRGSDYFALTAAPSPLEHTWSLGIEEQFYLVWPVVVYAVLYGARPGRAPWPVGADRRVRQRLSWLVAVCAAGAVTSTIALALVYSPDDPGRAYYGTDTRGGAILIGAGLAGLVALRTAGRPGLPGRPPAPDAARPVAGGRRLALGAAATGAAGVLGWASTHLSGTDEALYRGAMAGIALAVAAVIAHVVLIPTGVPARLLSLPPLPALGRISYGIYLWHWPVFLAANADRTGLEGLPLFATRCLLTLALAVVSYTLVERPVRLRVRVRRPLAALGLTGAAIAGGAAALVLSTAVHPLQPGPGDVPVGRAVDRFLARAEQGAVVAPDDRRRPRVEKATSRPPPPRLHTRIPGQPVVVDVFGDSVAWTLVTYLPDHPELDVRDHTLMGCGITRTAPFRYGDRLYRGLAPACRDWPHLWRAAIAADDPDVAFILVGRWETMDRVLDGRWTHIGQPDFDAHLRAELDLAIDVAGARGAHVLLATEPYNRRWEKLDGSLYPEDQPERVTLWNALLRSVAADHPGVQVVDLGRRVSPEGRFTWDAGGYQVRSDGLHLTPSGVQGWIAPWLLPQLIDAVPERRHSHARSQH
ncbi:acyltransferase family protein [Nocardioides xinjiangensis]|uniref:acyltransferase family protein n=1 Tax=Nocardioides xinjiangensis TaxID=2817376 RepID=UPI001B306DA8|nr:MULTISPECIES: acyltransferase family protein [unclassified Nocardioides]